MRDIRSFMGWTHVPEMDSSNPSDDNPFASPKAPVPSKVLVHNANRGLAMQEVEQAKYYSGVA